MLPEDSIEKIKFLDKKSLTEYVTPDQALVSWGGSSDYTFVFEPDTSTQPWGRNNNNEDKKVSFFFCLFFCVLSLCSNTFLFEPDTSTQPWDRIHRNNNNEDKKVSFIVLNIFCKI